MFDGSLAVKLAQWVLGNLMVFFTMAITVELCLAFFKINNPRLRSFGRCLPIIKLPLAAMFYGLVDVNLFSCASFLKPLFCSLFFSDEMRQILKSSPLSLPSYFAKEIPQVLLVSFSTAFLMGSIGFALIKGCRSLALMHSLEKTCREAKNCMRKIVNPKLKDDLKKFEINLLTTTAFHVPVAAGKRCILIPESLLKELSQHEFEAVIAHELEHLRWKDPFVKFLCSLTCTLFWWIPTDWWLQRLEEEQELASDAAIHRYGFDGCSLASALAKVIGKGREDRILCRFAAQKHIALRRVERMLGMQSPYLELSGLAYAGLAVSLMVFILIGYSIC